MGSEFGLLRTRKYRNEDFIINYSKNANNRHNNGNLPDINAFDQRRLIFISLIGLFKSWRNVPLIKLYSSILVLPIKAKWIQNPTRHQSEINDSFLGHLSMFRQDIKQTREFLGLLRWKQSQGLVFCMLDAHKSEKTNSNIHPFWQYLSDKLITLVDPFKNQCYEPLKMDNEWWKSGDFQSKYGVQTEEIWTELCRMTMKYQSMQEIIYQSNPQQLCPIISYDEYGQDDDKCKIESKQSEQLGFVILPGYDSETDTDGDIGNTTDFDAECSL